MQKPITIHKGIVYIPNQLLEIDCKQAFVNHSGFGTNSWFIIYVLIPILFVSSFIGQSLLMFGLTIAISIFTYFKYNSNRSVPKKITFLREGKSIIRAYSFTNKVQHYYYFNSFDFKVQIIHQKAVITLFDTQFELGDASKVLELMDCIAQFWDLTFFYAFTLSDGTEVLSYSASKGVSSEQFKIFKIKEVYKFRYATNDKLDYFSVNKKNGLITVFFMDHKNQKQQQTYTNYDTVFMSIQQIKRSKYLFSVAINSPNKEASILMKIEYSDELEIRKDEELCYRRLRSIFANRKISIIRNKSIP